MFIIHFVVNNSINGLSVNCASHSKSWKADLNNPFKLNGKCLMCMSSIGFSVYDVRRLFAIESKFDMFH